VRRNTKKKLRRRASNKVVLSIPLWAELRSMDQEALQRLCSVYGVSGTLNECRSQLNNIRKAQHV